jgi:O-antigen chain-terminating methyltransferase
LTVPAVELALVERLNEWWRIAGPAHETLSWKQRLALPFRRALARLLGPQETFNSALVQYVNAATTVHQQTADRIGSALDATLEEAEALMDDVRRFREALGARERRMEAAMTRILQEHEEIRTSIGTLQQRIRSDRSDRSNESNVPNVSNVPNDSNDSSDSSYVGFEDQFRGSDDAIRERLSGYLPVFEGAGNVLDIGCGRGEFLSLLGERGVQATGIDMNAAMVDVCREKGLAAARADALSYLRAQPDGSLGGLFAAQVVEHLEPGYLTRLLSVAFDKLRPGAAIVLETINPACWFAFFESYIRDITHVRPLHPDTLRFLLIASGFQGVEIQYRVPYPEHEKLQRIPAGTLGDSAEMLNANVDKLNSLLFTYLDYAAIARRP